MPDRLNLGAFLPLTPVAFEILLTLACGDQHGDAVMLDVERRTGGALSLHAGSLYRALNQPHPVTGLVHFDQVPAFVPNAVTPANPPLP